jgi:hypothetical protein
MLYSWKDEDEIIDTAKAQYRVLKNENEFRYGYKVVVIFSNLNCRNKVVRMVVSPSEMDSCNLLRICMGRKKGSNVIQVSFLRKILS